MRLSLLALLSAAALAPAAAAAPAPDAPAPILPSSAPVERGAGPLSAPNFEVRINGGATRYTGPQPLTDLYRFTIGHGSGSLGGRGRSAIRLDHHNRDLTTDWVVFRVGRVIELGGGSVNGNGTVFARARVRVTRSSWDRCPRGRRGVVSLFDGGLLQDDMVSFDVCGFELEYEGNPFTEVSVTIGAIATTEPPPSGEPF